MKDDIESTPEDIEEFFRANPQFLPILQNITLKRMVAELREQLKKAEDVEQ